MSKRYDVIVVGGGVMGLAIAMELRRRAAGSVALLERRFLGAGSSGKSGAILRQHYSHRETIRMARASLHTFAAFRETTGHDIGFTRTGMLFVSAAAEREALSQNIALQQSEGVRVELLDDAALSERFGRGRFEGVVAAWEPDAGYVDPVRTVGAFAAEARRYGAEIVTGCEVIGVRVADDARRVIGLDTTDGHYEAGFVVAATGPWSKPLLEPLGSTLPLEVVRPQQAFLRPPATPEPLHPVVADLPHAVYYKPEPGATRVGSISYDEDERVADPDRYDESVADTFLRDARARVARRFPDYESAVLWGGGSALYTVTPDAHAVIGPIAELENLLVVTGFSGHGFKLSPQVGVGVAEWILDGEPTSFDRGFFAAERFDRASNISTSYRYKILG